MRRLFPDVKGQFLAFNKNSLKSINKLSLNIVAFATKIE
ncbi:hypothetical protein RV10_GL002218 [Enterococcus pallens]|nr:hypothetical protein RV10_GL002218 [Enterococcus pallens]